MMIFFLLFLLVLGMVLQLRMGSRALDQLSCSLQVEEYLGEIDEPFRFSYTIENHSRLPVLYLRCRCNVPIEAKLSEDSNGELISYVNSCVYQFTCFLMPRQRVIHRFCLSFPHRGCYLLDNLQISVGDFLGIKERDARYFGSCTAVVLPKPLGKAVGEQVTGGLTGERSVMRWIHEDPILSAGFREYTGREPQKSIVWSRSLQSGKLMVRQMDHTAEDRVTVLFSLWDGNYESLEGCFSYCRTVCEGLEALHYPFAFLHNGTLATAVGILPPVESGLGRQHLNKILEGLGRATPEVTGSLSSLVRRALMRGQDSCCYLLIIPKLTQEAKRLAQELEARTGATVHILSREGLA